MKPIVFSFLITTTMGLPALAQYAPQANVAGSTAIASGGGSWKGWATGCTLSRGLQDIAQPSLGLASVGDSTLAIGAPDYQVVSLGDAGAAVLTFDKPIVNGPGPDFAVFENGFANPANPEESYMELAFVEVSSDGTNFFRFPAASTTQDTAQIAGTGQYMIARKVNNLAGKYISGFGTPFDLQEMTGITGLDVNHVTHVRVVDVVGAIGTHKSTDASGRTINDPYPTPFPSSGFDLDAVGVLNQLGNTAVAGNDNPWLLKAGPNPTSEVLSIRIGRPGTTLQLSLCDVSGKVLYRATVAGNNHDIPVQQLTPGAYLLQVGDEQGKTWSERIIVR